MKLFPERPEFVVHPPMPYPDAEGSEASSEADVANSDEEYERAERDKAVDRR
jgi:hypothetical protein